MLASSQIYVCISRRWQAPGAVKKRKKRPNREKSEGSCQCLLPIYVFDDSEQKVEFKVRIKPCSHQPNCMKFVL